MLGCRDLLSPLQRLVGSSVQPEHYTPVQIPQALLDVGSPCLPLGSPALDPCCRPGASPAALAFLIILFLLGTLCVVRASLDQPPKSKLIGTLPNRIQFVCTGTPFNEIQLVSFIVSIQSIDVAEGLMVY